MVVDLEPNIGEDTWRIAEETFNIGADKAVNLTSKIMIDLREAAAPMKYERAFNVCLTVAEIAVLVLSSINFAYTAIQSEPTLNVVLNWISFGAIICSAIVIFFTKCHQACKVIIKKIGKARAARNLDAAPVVVEMENIQSEAWKSCKVAAKEWYNIYGLAHIYTKLKEINRGPVLESTGTSTNVDRNLPSDVTNLARYSFIQGFMYSVGNIEKEIQGLRQTLNMDEPVKFFIRTVVIELACGVAGSIGYGTAAADASDDEKTSKIMNTLGCIGTIFSLTVVFLLKCYRQYWIYGRQKLFEQKIDQMPQIPKSREEIEPTWNTFSTDILIKWSTVIHLTPLAQLTSTM